MLRKSVVGIGLATMVFGVWLLGRVHSVVGVCNVTVGSSEGSTRGARSGCVNVLMSYTEGFVFLVSGLLLVVIAFTMISRRERLNLRSELRAVPRTWKKPDYTANSEPVRVEQIAKVARRRHVLTGSG
jgi:hypothetical protein